MEKSEETEIPQSEVLFNFQQSLGDENLLGESRGAAMAPEFESLNKLIYDFVDGCLSTLAADSSLEGKLAADFFPEGLQISHPSELLISQPRLLSLNEKELDSSNDEKTTELLSSHAHPEGWIESNEAAEDAGNAKKNLQSSFPAGLQALKPPPLLPPGLGTPDKPNSLYIAAFLGNCEKIQALIGEGCNVNMCDELGRAALHYAAAAGRYSPAKLILDAGAEIDKVDHKSWSPLLIAVNKNFYEVSKLLLDYKADLNSTLGHNLQPSRGPERVWSKAIHFSAIQGNEEICKLLIEYGADVNSRDSKNRTPLHYAACRGHIGYVKYVLENGALANAIDDQKRSPLHSAAMGNQVAIAEMLLQHGCPLDLIDIYDLDAKSLAKARDNFPMFLLLGTFENPIVSQGPNSALPSQQQRSSLSLEPFEETVTSTIQVGLNEPNVDLLRRVIRRIGSHKSLNLFLKSLEAIKQGGMLTADGSRARTPGGIFFHLLRQLMLSGGISSEDWAYIKQEDKERFNAMRNRRSKSRSNQEEKFNEKGGFPTFRRWKKNWSTHKPKTPQDAAISSNGVFLAPVSQHSLPYIHIPGGPPGLYPATFAISSPLNPVGTNSAAGNAKNKGKFDVKNANFSRNSAQSADSNAIVTTLPVGEIPSYPPAMFSYNQANENLSFSFQNVCAIPGVIETNLKNPPPEGLVYGGVISKDVLLQGVAWSQNFNAQNSNPLLFLRQNTEESPKAVGRVGVEGGEKKSSDFHTAPHYNTSELNAGNPLKKSSERSFISKRLLQHAAGEGGGLAKDSSKSRATLNNRVVHFYAAEEGKSEGLRKEKGKIKGNELANRKRQMREGNLQASGRGNVAIEKVNYNNSSMRKSFLGGRKGSEEKAGILAVKHLPPPPPPQDFLESAAVSVQGDAELSKNDKSLRDVLTPGSLLDVRNEDNKMFPLLGEASNMLKITKKKQKAMLSIGNKVFSKVAIRNENKPLNV